MATEVIPTDIPDNPLTGQVRSAPPILARVIATAIGLFLLAAAWLKATGVGSTNPLGWLGLPAVWSNVTGVILEVFLAA